MKRAMVKESDREEDDEEEGTSDDRHNPNTCRSAIIIKTIVLV